MYCSPMTCGYDVLAAKIAAMGEAAVLSIDYPLAPIGNVTTILDAAEKALVWLSTHGPRGCRNGADAAPPLAILGDSSGGGTAISLLLRRSAVVQRVSAAVLFSP